MNGARGMFQLIPSTFAALATAEEKEMRDAIEAARTKPWEYRPMDQRRPRR